MVIAALDCVRPPGAQLSGFSSQNGRLQEKGAVSGWQTDDRGPEITFIHKYSVWGKHVMAALHDLEVKASGVQNAFIIAPSTETMHTGVW